MSTIHARLIVTARPFTFTKNMRLQSHHVLPGVKYAKKSSGPLARLQNVHSALASIPRKKLKVAKKKE